MNATELRIGNWVNNIHTGEPYQVNIAKMIRLLQHFKKDVIYTAPIPLTEEWLVKFGFESSGDDGYSCNWDIKKMCIVQGALFIEDKNGVKLKHVHSLQNLYFALTGKEL
tara:strand:+ start:362 stop:691 length:330 start_codon:yes stop_codon:yes gene_type:complete